MRARARGVHNTPNIMARAHSAAATIDAWSESFSVPTCAQTKSSAVQPWPSPQTLKQLFDHYADSTLMQLAVRTLTAELLRDALVWKGHERDEVPAWVDPVIRRAIEILAVLGFIIWRVTPAGVVELAEHEEMTIAWDEGAREWIPLALHPDLDKTPGWVITMTHRPRTRVTRKSGRVVVTEITSPCVAAWAESHRAMAIERSFLRRDLHNSRPSVFTTVAGDLGISSHRGAAGAQLRNLVSSHGLAGSEMESVADFTNLIHKRAEKLARLEDLSQKDRSRITTAGQYEAFNMGDEASYHSEFVVTDGKQASEAKSLLSLSDSAVHYARARQAAMAAMGVPLQALGESVSTERQGSNHKQYSTALELFALEIARYRKAVLQPLAGGGTNAIVFKRCHRPSELEAIAPLMKTTEALAAMACTYDVDSKRLEKKHVEMWQQERLGGADDKPGPDSSVSERTITNKLSSGGSSE